MHVHACLRACESRSQLLLTCAGSSRAALPFASASLPAYLPACLSACLPGYLPACLPFCLPTCLPSQVILDAETFRGVHARLNELGGAVLEATQGLLGGRLTRTVMAAATAGMLKQAADKEAADIEQQQQQGALRMLRHCCAVLRCAVQLAVTNAGLPLSYDDGAS
jgi:hypothetical protein